MCGRICRACIKNGNKTRVRKAWPKSAVITFVPVHVAIPLSKTLFRFSCARSVSFIFAARSWNMALLIEVPRAHENSRGRKPAESGSVLRFLVDQYKYRSHEVPFLRGSRRAENNTESKFHFYKGKKWRKIHVSPPSLVAVEHYKG